MATICFHHVQASIQGALARGRDRNQLLRVAGIPNSTFLSQQRLHTTQVARLFVSVQQELKDELMGMSPTTMPLGAFNIALSAAYASNNLGQALAKVADFFQYADFGVSFEIEPIANRVWLRPNLRYTEADTQGFMREYLLVIWHRVSSWLINSPIVLDEVEFSFAKPKHMAELSVMFATDCRFNAPHCGLAFDASLLQRPIMRTRTELSEFFADYPNNIMVLPGAESDREAQIYHLLHRALSQREPWPSMAQLSLELGVSSQNIYRHLAASGQSVQKIKNDVRREIAIKQLQQGSLSIEVIAELLGYSEARSFTRAFKHWTGQSPRNYRHLQQHK